MNFRRSPSERRSAKITRVAGAKAEYVIAEHSLKLNDLHRGFFTNVASGLIPQVEPSRHCKDNNFVPRYGTLLGDMAVSAFTKTERARRRHLIDEASMAREVGSAIFTKTAERRLSMADQCYSDTGLWLRSNNSLLSKGKIILSSVAAIGTVASPSERLRKQESTRNPGNYFAETFETIRLSEDPYEARNTVGVLQLASELAIWEIITQEAAACIEATEERMAKILPKSQAQSR